MKFSAQAGPCRVQQMNEALENVLGEAQTHLHPHLRTHAIC
jgi:hypothetical protein